MGDPAFALTEEIGEQAVRQTVRLTVIQGGAAATEAGAAAAAEAGVGLAAAEAGGAVAAEAGVGLGVGGGAAGGAVLSGAALTGIGLVVIGLAALGYYLYTRSPDEAEQSPKLPEKPSLTGQCPGNPEPVTKPPISPKPVPLDPTIPNPDGQRRAQRNLEEQRKKRCPELWDEIQRRTNSRRSSPGSGTQGVKYRYWDNICSEHDPSTPGGAEIWESHREAFENDQAGLKDALDEFQEKCEGDLPAHAETYAKDKGFPDPKEWDGNSQDCILYRRLRQEWYDRYLWGMK